MKHKHKEMNNTRTKTRGGDHLLGERHLLARSLQLRRRPGGPGGRGGAGPLRQGSAPA